MNIIRAIRRLFFRTPADAAEGVYEPRGVLLHRRKVLLFSRKRGDYKNIFRFLASGNGTSFSPLKKELSIVLPSGHYESPEHVARVSIGHFARGYSMVYLRESGGKRQLVSAASRNLFDWNVRGVSEQLTEASALVSDYTHQDKRVLYTGEHTITLATSKNGLSWTQHSTPIAEPRNNRFDSAPLTVLGAGIIEQGILVLYESSQQRGGQRHLQVGALLCDRNDPSHVVWRSDVPLWEQVVDAGRTASVGALVTNSKLFCYWQTEKLGLITIVLPNPHHTTGALTDKRVRVEKHPHNPVLSPKHEHDWEAVGTFNPATIELNGKVHMLYRALARDGSSSFGYAASDDGVHITERDTRPAYWARKDFEGAGHEPTGWSPAYPSGGGWGGCEDPKIAMIDDRIYLTYVAFPGHWPPHTAISSISKDDFLHKHWKKWSEPALMSPPDLDSKSVCLLSEKIDGKYVVFHRNWPDIVVEYVDSLEYHHDDHWINVTPFIPLWRNNENKCVVIHGTWPNLVTEDTEHEHDHDVLLSPRWKELTNDSARIPARLDNWDSHKISMAATPVKTPYGWLAIYSAVDKKDFSRYKIGAMLLDLERPEKVLYRTNAPILLPEEWYEHDWKPNIVYPSGVLVIDDTLHIYYGGGDKYVCVATAPLERFLNELMRESAEPPQVEAVRVS